jgi:hypothetical protein
MLLKTKITKSLSYALAAGFLFFGAQKFGVENAVFEIIAERSGIDIFEPVIRRLTGVAELVTAALFLVPNARIKKLASLSAAAVLLGAIGFHLSPWLGINVPGIGHGLFGAAVLLLALNTVLLRTYFPSKRTTQKRQVLA